MILCAVGLAIGSCTEIRKILAGELYRYRAIRGQLCDQHLAVGIGHSLVIAVVEDVPKAANQIIHDEVVAGLKGRNPILVGACYRAHGGRCRAILGGVSNRDPAVIDQVREKSEQAGHDACGSGRPYWILVEGSGCPDFDGGGCSSRVHR